MSSIIHLSEPTRARLLEISQRMNLLDSTALETLSIRQARDYLKQCDALDERSRLELYYELMQDWLAVDRIKPMTTNAKGESLKQSRLWTLLLTLGVAGGVYNGLCGFDGVIAILMALTDNAWLIYLPSSFFALVATLIFISFDFKQAAITLGVQSSDAVTELSRLFFIQKGVKQQLDELEEALIQAKEPQDYQRITANLDLLSQYQSYLNQKKDSLQNAALPQKVWLAQKTLAFLCGLLFLSNGFFTGQAGALFILGTSSISAGMATTLGAALIVSLSIVAAIGATAFYFMVQKPAVEELAGRMMGYDTAQQSLFCSNEVQHSIASRIQRKQQLTTKFFQTVRLQPSKANSNDKPFSESMQRPRQSVADHVLFFKHADDKVSAQCDKATTAKRVDGIRP